MTNLLKYLEDPCGELSIPYWKNKIIKIPENMKIVHNRDFKDDLLTDYSDCMYFRLLHDLQDIPAPSVCGIKIKTAAQNDLPEIVSVINASYDDISTTLEQMQKLRQSPAFAPELWVLAEDAITGETVGCGMADFDAEAGELILEWIQVLPNHRRKGIGAEMVHELLRRKPEGAAFATVSGKADDPSAPEALYRSCGFTGEDYWHILIRNKK
jgi:predicted N-acetyltransferase YhbS